MALAVGALIAALVIGESLGASLRDLERSRLGPIDVSVGLRGPAAVEGAREIREALSQHPGVTATTLRALQVTAVSGLDPTGGNTEDSRPVAGRLAEPSAVAFDYRYEELGPFSRGIPYGLPASGPTAGSVFVSGDLARVLDVSKGDEIALIVGTTAERFRVEAILEPEGISGYGESLEKPILSVFLPEGYLDEIPAVTEVLISVGTPRGASFDDARAKAEDEISGLRPVFDSLAARGTRPVVRLLKADLIRAAKRIANAQTSQMIQLGSFSLLSALGLLATVLYLVLSERRRLSGVLLAAGMRRREIAAANDVHGLAVAVPGIAGGLVLGVAVAWVAVIYAGGAVGRQIGGFRSVVSVPFSIVGSTGGAGILVTALFIRASSMVLLSSYPAELISGRERPLRLPGIAVLGGGLGLIAFGVATAAADLRVHNPTFSFLGPPLAAAGAALLALPTRFRRLIGGLAGVFVVGWIAYLERSQGATLQPPEFRALPVVVAAALLGGAVAALVAGVGPAESTVRRILDAAGWRMVGLRTAMRSLEERRGAVWFVVQTSAAAVAVLAMVLGVFVLERSDFERLERGQLGEWSGAVALRAPGVEDPGALVKRTLQDLGFDSEADVATLRSIQKFVRVVAGGRGLTRIYEVPEAVGSRSGGFIPLIGRNARFASDAEAWKALFDENPPEGRRWVIMSEGAVDLGNVSPASAVLADPESQKNYMLAGITAKNDIIPGVYAAPGAVDAGSGSYQPSTVVFRVQMRTDSPSRLAAELQGRLLAYGASVTLSSEVVMERLEVRRLVSFMLRIFLSLGLVVAVAAQAAVITRAVRARTRSLAVLRALGAPSGVIFRSVAVEGLSMALLGSVAGSLVGSAVALRIYSRTGGSASVLGIASTAALLVALSTAVVGLASLLPARMAARTYPAQTLRNPEE